MAIKAHMETLEQRPQQLEARIMDETKPPAHDDLQVAELKRQKLRIKDELEELRSQHMKPN